MVRFVTAVVRPVKPPTTPAAKVDVPLITFAAKSEPGICGRDIRLPPDDPTLAGVLLPLVPARLRPPML